MSMYKLYPSDLEDEQWELAEPVITAWTGPALQDIDQGGWHANVTPILDQRLRAP